MSLLGILFGGGGRGGSTGGSGSTGGTSGTGSSGGTASPPPPPPPDNTMGGPPASGGAGGSGSGTGSDTTGSGASGGSSGSGGGATVGSGATTGSGTTSGVAPGGPAGSASGSGSTPVRPVGTPVTAPAVRYDFGVDTEEAVARAYAIASQAKERVASLIEGLGKPVQAARFELMDVGRPSEPAAEAPATWSDSPRRCASRTSSRARRSTAPPDPETKPRGRPHPGARQPREIGGDASCPPTRPSSRP